MNFNFWPSTTHFSICKTLRCNGWLLMICHIHGPHSRVQARCMCAADWVPWVQQSMHFFSCAPPKNDGLEGSPWHVKCRSPSSSRNLSTLFLEDSVSVPGMKWAHFLRFISRRGHLPQKSLRCYLSEMCPSQGVLDKQGVYSRHQK